MSQRDTPSEPRRSRGTRRAAPEVVDKRRAARRFNALVEGGGRATGLDGRTDRRRQRMLVELREGVARASKKALKPIDVLSRVQALLEMGEPLASIRRACRPARPVVASADLIEGLRSLHEAYGFPIAAYAFVGLDEETLRAAGISAGVRPGVRAASPREPSRARRGGAA
jgi:hypothetical protein